MKEATRHGVGGNRPGSGGKPAGSFRLPDDVVAQVDAWAAVQEDKPGRSEAIRRLVEIALHAGATAEVVRVHNKASDYATMASDLAEELGLKTKK